MTPPQKQLDLIKDVHDRLNSTNKAIDAINARLDDEFSVRMNDHGRALAELKGQFVRLDDRRSGSDRRGR